MTTARRKAQDKAAKPFREAMRAEPVCWVCGHGPFNPWKDKPQECSEIHAHEIRNGIGYRDVCQGLPCGCLAACNWCNQHVLTNKGLWPESRQLAVLLTRRPESFNLPLYLETFYPRAPNRVTMQEVLQWGTDYPWDEQIND